MTRVKVVTLKNFTPSRFNLQVGCVRPFLQDFMYSGNILSDLFTIISLRHKIVTTCLFLRTHLHLDFLLQVVVDDSVVVLFLEGNLVVLAIGFAHHEAVDLSSALVLEFLYSV